MDVGGPEILIIIAVIALLFGAKKIPELARSLGRSASEFRRGMREGGTADEQGEQPPA